MARHWTAFGAGTTVFMGLGFMDGRPVRR